MGTYIHRGEVGRIREHQLTVLGDTGPTIDHARRFHEPLTRYADVPMSFADACLVTLAETLRDARVFTIDRDCKIYRRTRNRRLELIMPR